MEATSLQLDCAGRRRSPATLPGYHRGRPPRNKGLRYPPDPPTVDEIVAVMSAAGETADGPLSWQQLDPWRALRRTLPVGPLFCVLRGATRGRPCAPATIRGQLRQTAARAGVRRRFAPHQL